MMSNSVKKKPAIAVCNFTNYFRSSKHWGGSKEDFPNLMLADAKIKKKLSKAAICSLTFVTMYGMNNLFFLSTELKM